MGAVMHANVFGSDENYGGFFWREEEAQASLAGIIYESSAASTPKKRTGK